MSRGVFQKMVPVFNRAPIALHVQFDGQRYTIQPGHDQIPDMTIPFAKNQNPVMGSQDPNNPHMSGARYLIVEKGEDGYDQPMTKAEWEAHVRRPCRIDEQAAFEERYGGDVKAKLVTQGRPGKVAATSRADANAGSVASFGRQD